MGGKLQVQGEILPILGLFPVAVCDQMLLTKQPKGERVYSGPQFGYSPSAAGGLAAPTVSLREQWMDPVLNLIIQDFLIGNGPTQVNPSERIPCKHAHLFPR